MKRTTDKNRNALGGLVLSLLNEGRAAACLLYSADTMAIPPDLHDCFYAFFDGEDVTLLPDEDDDNYGAWRKSRASDSLMACVQSQAGRLASEMDYLVPAHVTAKEVLQKATDLVDGLRLLQMALIGEVSWPEWERYANAADHTVSSTSAGGVR
jgi:hypothetical protein